MTVFMEHPVFTVHMISSSNSNHQQQHMPATDKQVDCYQARVCQNK